MTKYHQAAQANIDKHAGDVIHGDMDEAEMMEELFTLAFDGAHDAGATPEMATAIALELSGQG